MVPCHAEEATAPADLAENSADAEMMVARHVREEEVVQVADLLVPQAAARGLR